jgi:hypothetical protein
MKKIIAAALTYARNREKQKTVPWNKEKDQNELFAAMREFGMVGIHACAGSHFGTLVREKRKQGNICVSIDIGDQIEISFSNVSAGIFADPIQFGKHPLVRIINFKEDLIQEELIEKLADLLLGEKLPLDICRADTGEVLIPANKKITKTWLRSVAIHREQIEIDPSPIRNRVLETIYRVEQKFEKEN